MVFVFWFTNFINHAVVKSIQKKRAEEDGSCSTPDGLSFKIAFHISEKSLELTLRLNSLSE
jgi:hypothetical protein